MKDVTRDNWIEDILGDDKIFDRSAAKILMRLAYEEGRKREQSKLAASKRKPEGPYEID